MTEATHVHRNVSTATIAGFEKLLSEGKIVRVRNQEIREVRNHLAILSNPLERCLFVPHRRNSIFVSLAETMWVLAGRNDIQWLMAYLPRAVEFSDDGLTWRGGYGPRLRNWSGVDQISKSRELLIQEPATRRATMSLFDPARDFAESRDIPCNNWLHWLLRDGKLHLNVALRSNDIVWGFSGVNCFEWSILHEAMAFWLGVEVGDVTYLASSFHLYSRHYSIADQAVRAFKGTSCYDFSLRSPRFSTPWVEFDRTLTVWFRLENEIRKDPERVPQYDHYFSDPLLIAFLELLRIYHGAVSGWVSERICDELSRLRPSDLVTAAYEYFCRKHPVILNRISHPAISAFLTTYASDGHAVIQDTPKAIVKAVKVLHRQKNAAYGSAWKRRGEFTSILANIARKVDRLEQYQHSPSDLADETIFDTVIDLFVYCNKYMLFLLERILIPPPNVLPPDAPSPYSDHVSNFDWLVDHIELSGFSNVTDNESMYFRSIIADFEKLHIIAADGDSTVKDRLLLVQKVRDQAFTLLIKFPKVTPNTGLTGQGSNVGEH